MGGAWDERISGRCRWCGALFPVSQTTLDVIGGITREAALAPEASPCLSLPDEAWEEPGLLGSCPACGGQVKWNPWAVDERERLGG